MVTAVACLHFLRVIAEAGEDGSVLWFCRECQQWEQARSWREFDASMPGEQATRQRAQELRAARAARRERQGDDAGEDLVSRIVSFSWTAPALLAGHKTVTRRDWSPSYGRQFKAGDLVTAYDRSPRNHGRAIARLRLTADALLQPDAEAPDSDYEGEGFAFFSEHPEQLPKGGRESYRVTVQREQFDQWRRAGGRSWVIRFEVSELMP